MLKEPGSWKDSNVYKAVENKIKKKFHFVGFAP